MLLTAVFINMNSTDMAVALVVYVNVGPMVQYAAQAFIE